MAEKNIIEEYKKSGNISGTEEEKTKIREYIDTLCKSKQGKKLIESAAKNNTIIRFDVQHTGSYFIPEYNMVSITPHKEDDANIGGLAHELRHAEQASYGLYKYSRKLSPPRSICLTRVAEADAEARAVAVCKELKDAGIEAPWEYRRNGKLAPTKIAEVYEKTIEENPASEHDGTAIQNATRQWMNFRRVRDQYDNDALDAMNFDPNLVDKEREIMRSMVHKVGDMGNGVNYMLLDGGPKSVQNDPYFMADVAPELKRKLAKEIHMAEKKVETIKQLEKYKGEAAKGSSSADSIIKVIAQDKSR